MKRLIQWLKMHREIARIIGFKEWFLNFTRLRLMWSIVLIYWFARHNARVIADFETRMVAVIYAATRGAMAKAYYGTDDMVDQINKAFELEYDEGHADGVKDERARQNAIRRGKGKAK